MNTPTTTYTAFETGYRDARAAIAKARGES